ncbi:hypothetical protein COU37_02075 [Candidatus Micrarchaeota archaeon CG10_big_fil_rev_8_21_14_0_10_45_29]|nr:MAG: hypothetical protein COU37_02075 [Candidatus Micrarchaeota archaeon CG10_big_fil_rev_8_21_14_0_10_45_29]
MKNALFIALALFCIILLFGCIHPGTLGAQDRFNSKTTINVSQKTNLEPASDSATPCTCMICSQEEPSIFDEIWYALGIQDKLIENDLQGANCYFEACNSSIYASLLSEFDAGKGVWAQCPQDASSSSSGNSQNKYDDKVCAPRYFMLGQGASSAEFSLAQRYCSGRLNMPIIWAYSKDGKEPPKPPSPQTLMCHLSKSQMPFVIWYSNAEHIDDEAYKKMVDSYNDATDDPPTEGPIMLSTEALLEPYKTNAKGEKFLNIQMLEKVRAQIDYTALNCPSCIPVLALKPTFTTDGLPDLCPIDYFLRFNTSLADLGGDPLNCSSKYENPSQYSSRPATRENYLKKIGAIGIAFIANENANLTTCTPMYDIARHLRYSDELLLHYHSPSVWYAVGISPGATNTPNCAFSEAEVADAYSFLMAGIPGFVASGVIGVSPYTFLSSTAPLPCKSQLSYGSLDYAAFSSIGANKKFTTLQGAQINSTKVFFKNDTHLSFQDEFSNYYIAYYDEPTFSFMLNLTGCNFGFRQTDGSMQNLTSFSWFSACQLYFTNNAPLFEADISSISQIRAGTQIKPKIGGLPSLQVLSINSSEDGHVIFFSGDKRYSAKKDGERIMIYDMPRLNYSQQPLMFSTNSVGSTCAPFESGKMLYYTSLSRPSDFGQYGISPPQSPQELEKIAALQCGGCLSSVPMPFNFCSILSDIGTVSFPKDACTQYPEMDISFISHSLDPILMRAISVGEGSRLGRQSSEPSPNAPACTISPTDRSDWCGNKTQKQPSNLAKFEYPYCTGIEQKAQNIVTAYGGICALGLMQCIKPPSDDYNPFNPVDSADCGSYEFKEKAGRYDSYLKILQNMRASNPSIDAFNPKKGGIGANEIEWYAAWIAAYRYSGMRVVNEALIRNYAQQDSGDNIVKYVHRETVSYCADLRQKDPKADCYPFYGTKAILLYNEAISVCSNGCPHQTCEALAEGDDGYEDETYLD